MTFTDGLLSLIAAATPLIMPPPPTGASTVSTSGKSLQNFQPHRALARNDLFVVVRRNDGVSVLGGEFFRFRSDALAAGPDSHDFRAQAGRCLAFDRGRIPRHHDDGFDSERPRGIGHALRMIAAGIGDDSALSSSFGVREAILL